MNAKIFLLTAWAVLGALIATPASPAPGTTADVAPLKLTWDSLVPLAPPKKPKFLLGGGGAQTHNPDAAQQAEGRWMSQRAAGEAPAPVVEALNGKLVEIGGYVVPLDFEATKIKEFLLVPFVGACVHVPPPPANQIVYVKVSEAFEIKSMFEPVTVRGTLQTTTAFTGLADAGYTLDADLVAARKK